MAESTYPSWQASLDFLRGCISVPAALGNATTLMAARRRWSQHLICRTSMHDLLFTRPGDAFPFDDSVRVHIDGVQHLVRRTHLEEVTEQECSVDDVDRVLDDALEALCAPAQVCRACGELAATEDFLGVFERMHYVCFHFEFEHPEADRDQACGIPGCPIG